MMKGLIVLCLVALWQVANVQGEESFDPRANPRINDAIKEYSRYHCYYRCHQNPDDCSVDARRDLTTCENQLYWAYFTNYEVCRTRCAVECDERCQKYTDCSEACLKVGSDKIRLSPKTPDQLIRTYFDNRRAGRTDLYIE
ncbi:hypothetical protein TSAR_002202 [Trichomalopsis sarcophagae]|uniref:ShKT domain-containing protein n=1 Tax=Trichomalopsis sarcophagae TaxID=543379 RepID=A0A232FF62_9HYME|nr:hypothetical protein TSAR_002202 [Trichomalopsis sarcophagae]